MFYLASCTLICTIVNISILFVTASSYLVDEHYQKFSIASVMNLSENLPILPKHIIMYSIANVMCSLFFIASRTDFFGQKCDSPRISNDIYVNNSDFLFFARLFVLVCLKLKINSFKVSKHEVHFTAINCLKLFNFQRLVVC